ncbi:MAG: amidohydrolase [Snowella sp.]|nr:amidohydrolase [Snowella sp.]
MPLPNCICRNPLFNEFVTQLSRRKFLLGTGAFAATVLADNLHPKTATAQTEGLRMLGDNEKTIENLNPITVFVAKKIITMEADQKEATAVAVESDRILAVGSLNSIKTQLGSRPYTLDRTFADKVIMPGFVEHHVHPMLGVLTMAVEIISIEDWTVPGKNSKAVPDEKTYIARLQEALSKMSGTDPNETLFTWGYHHYFHGKIYRPQLDEIERNRPIVIWHRSCHEFILNTAALKKYGITETTLQGRGLASEQSNWEKGHFFEKGMEIIVPFIGKDLASPERAKEGLKIFKLYLLSKGITTICEPGTLSIRPMHEFWENGLNTEDTNFRTYFVPDGRSLFDKYKNDPDALLAKVESFKSWGRGKVQWLPMQIKLFADGAIFSQAMQMQKPYLDGHKGEWIALPEDYTTAFKLFWDAGYQIHTHVNGDEGLQVVTDGLEERFNANPRQDHRFTVVHFAVSSEEQVKRFGKMNALISANPYYVRSLADRYSEFGLGPERADNMVRLGSVAKTGMPIGLHSDMPMAPADPLFLAWCAINRITVSGRTAAPDQRISIDLALKAITLEAAYFMRLENEIGSIKAGKKADFAILEQDPFAVPVTKLKDITVWGCVFEGQKFQAPKTASKATLSSNVNIAPEVEHLGLLTQAIG